MKLVLASKAMCGTVGCEAMAPAGARVFECAHCERVIVRCSPCSVRFGCVMTCARCTNHPVRGVPLNPGPGLDDDAGGYQANARKLLEDPREE